MAASYGRGGTQNGVSWTFAIPSDGDTLHVVLVTLLRVLFQGGHRNGQQLSYVSGTVEAG